MLEIKLLIFTLIILLHSRPFNATEFFQDNLLSPYRLSQYWSFSRWFDGKQAPCNKVFCHPRLALRWLVQTLTWLYSCWSSEVANRRGHLFICLWRLPLSIGEICMVSLALWTSNLREFNAGICRAKVDSLCMSELAGGVGLRPRLYVCVCRPRLHVCMCACLFAYA